MLILPKIDSITRILSRMKIESNIRLDKEFVQYTVAILALISGIVMCFLSFFLNNYEIAGSVLGYFGECLVFTSGVFGISIYIKSKFVEAGASMKAVLDKLEKKIEDIGRKEDRLERRYSYADSEEEKPEDNS